MSPTKDGRQRVRLKTTGPGNRWLNTIANVTLTEKLNHVVDTYMWLVDKEPKLFFFTHHDILILLPVVIQPIDTYVDRLYNHVDVLHTATEHQAGTLADLRASLAQLQQMLATEPEKAAHIITKTAHIIIEYGGRVYPKD